MPADEWTTSKHVDRYLDRADEFPRRRQGEDVLLEHISRDARCVLDVGTGDGRLLALLSAIARTFAARDLTSPSSCSRQRASVRRWRAD
jgi:hypothetical protein